MWGKGRNKKNLSKISNVFNIYLYYVGLHKYLYIYTFTSINIYIYTNLLPMHFPEKYILLLIDSFISNNSIEITILLWESKIYIFINNRIIMNLSDGMDNNFITKLEIVFQPSV